MEVRDGTAGVIAAIRLYPMDTLFVLAVRALVGVLPPKNPVNVPVN
jgi:hypothetical protein